jgi:hypothetical protein
MGSDKGPSPRLAFDKSLCSPLATRPLRGLGGLGGLGVESLVFRRRIFPRARRALCGKYALQICFIYVFYVFSYCVPDLSVLCPRFKCRVPDLSVPLGGLGGLGVLNRLFSAAASFPARAARSAVNTLYKFVLFMFFMFFMFFRIVSPI